MASGRVRPGLTRRPIRRTIFALMSLPLSVAIVCKDSEATIARTLESVKGLAAEIVALDSGSNDGTIRLLERAGARVERVEWRGHVATKQAALDACSQGWVLSLDSDESLEPDLRAAVERAVSSPTPGIDGHEVNRKVYYRDRPLNFAWQPEWRLRLVRRGAARWGGMDPHDKLGIVSGGRVARLTGTLRHDSIGTFAEFLTKQAAHARTMAASMAREGRRGRVSSLFLSPPGSLFKQLVLKQAWRDGWPGILAAASTAAGTLIKHAVLIEMTRTENDLRA